MWQSVNECSPVIWPKNNAAKLLQRIATAIHSERHALDATPTFTRSVTRVHDGKKCSSSPKTAYMGVVLDARLSAVFSVRAGEAGQSAQNVLNLRNIRHSSCYAGEVRDAWMVRWLDK